LIYALAVESQISKVINGREHGGHVKELAHYTEEYCETLRPSEVFLDDATGDVYSYEHTESLWKPIGNVGVHNKHKAGHKPKAIYSADHGLMDLSDTICITIKRSQYPHWAL
jgi:hypothetical protein